MTEYNYDDLPDSAYDDPGLGLKDLVKSDCQLQVPDSVLKGVISVHAYALHGYCYIVWKEEKGNASLAAFTENNNCTHDPIIEKGSQIGFIQKRQGQCTWLFDD